LNSRHCNMHVDCGYVLWRVELAAGMIIFEHFGPKVYLFGLPPICNSAPAPPRPQQPQNRLRRPPFGCGASGDALSLVVCMSTEPIFRVPCVSLCLTRGSLCAAQSPPNLPPSPIPSLSLLSFPHFSLILSPYQAHHRLQPPANETGVQPQLSPDRIHAGVPEQ
jgi:hypothetical protein